VSSPLAWRGGPRLTEGCPGSPGTFVPHGSDAEPVEHAPVVTTDDEGTEMPEAAVKASMKESYVRI
jgi:hypothetical protein